MWDARRPAMSQATAVLGGNGPGQQQQQRERKASALPPWERLRELAAKHSTEGKKAKDDAQDAAKSKVSVAKHEIRYEGLSLKSMPGLSPPTGLSRRGVR